MAKTNQKAVSAPAKGKQDWGQLGAAMRSLPNEQIREFVRAYVTCPLPSTSKTRPDFVYGRLTYAARAAGYGKNSKKATLGKQAWLLSQDDRVLAAIEEETRNYLRRTVSGAVPAFANLINDPTHPGHTRAVIRAVDAIDPVVSRQNIEVTHKVVNPDQEALEELQALRQIGATREKLLELFGGNGLARLERLEAADISRRAMEAKIIDGTHEVING